jgi:hypothetical protein
MTSIHPNFIKCISTEVIEFKQLQVSTILPVLKIKIGTSITQKKRNHRLELMELSSPADLIKYQLRLLGCSLHISKLTTNRVCNPHSNTDLLEVINRLMSHITHLKDPIFQPVATQLSNIQALTDLLTPKVHHQSTFQAHLAPTTKTLTTNQ